MKNISQILMVLVLPAIFFIPSPPIAAQTDFQIVSEREERIRLKQGDCLYFLKAQTKSRELQRFGDENYYRINYLRCKEQNPRSSDDEAAYLRAKYDQERAYLAAKCAARGIGEGSPFLYDCFQTERQLLTSGAPKTPSKNSLEDKSKDHELASAKLEIARIKAEADALKAQAPQATQNLNYPAINSAHALVIGNSSYAGGASLANPVNDAKAISKKLRSLGFKVTEVIDASRAQMVRSLSKFSETSGKADVTLLFYAGHGVQISGINYMIPVDTNLSDLSEATLQAISLNSVVERYLPGKTKLVFLDACRDNPLMTASSRGVTRGLAPINVSEGTLISYATKDGQTAADGTGRMNSPYTAALLEHLADPQDIAVVLRKVRAKVMKSTKGKQQPWEYGSLTGGELILSAIKQGVRATPSTSVASSEQPSSDSSSALQGSSDVVTPSTTQERKISQHIRINSSKAPKSFSDGAAMIIRFNTQGWVWVRESSDTVREFLTKAGDIVRFDELPLFIVLPFPDQVEVTIANSPVTLLRNDDEKNAARYSKFMLKQLVSRR